MLNKKTNEELLHIEIKSVTEVNPPFLSKQIDSQKSEFKEEKNAVNSTEKFTEPILQDDNSILIHNNPSCSLYDIVATARELRRAGDFLGALNEIDSAIKSFETELKGNILQSKEADKLIVKRPRTFSQWSEKEKLEFYEDINFEGDYDLYITLKEPCAEKIEQLNDDIKTLHYELFKIKKNIKLIKLKQIQTS